MSNDTIAGSGLEKMFYGQILSILVIIPLVGWIAAIVGIVLFLVGLHEAAGADEGYRTAFYVEIGILVLSVLAVFIGVLNIVTSILSLVVIYLVCTTTAGLLEVKGDLGTAARGRFAWKFYGGCTALVVVCSILSLIPLVNILAMVVIVPASIASVVGGILLLIFLTGPAKVCGIEYGKTRRESAAFCIQAGISSPWMKPPSWAESTSPPMTVLL